MQQRMSGRTNVALAVAAAAAGGGRAAWHADKLQLATALGVAKTKHVDMWMYISKQNKSACYKNNCLLLVNNFAVRLFVSVWVAVSRCVCACNKHGYNQVSTAKDEFITDRSRQDIANLKRKNNNKKCMQKANNVACQAMKSSRPPAKWCNQLVSQWLKVWMKE